MEYKETDYKIGDIFSLKDGTKLEVVKSVLNCKGCYFFNEETKSCNKPRNTAVCSLFRRKDKTAIIFKQIKNNNMEEKRSIQISLEEAREWYNSDDSFKKELALKSYNKEELEETYFHSVVNKVSHKIKVKNAEKADLYLKLLNTAAYVNNIYSSEYCKVTKEPFQYILSFKGTTSTYTQPTWYKHFWINKVSVYFNDSFIITFNSEEAAKKAIDILGDELKILFM